MLLFLSINLNEVIKPFISLLPNTVNLSFSLVRIVSFDTDKDILTTSYCPCEISGLLENKSEKYTDKIAKSGIINKNIGSNAAAIDLNNDGRIDIIEARDSEIRIYKNTIENNKNFVEFRETDKNFDDLKNVRIYYDNNKQSGFITREQSIIINLPSFVHFGLDKNAKIDSAEFIYKEGTKTVYNINPNKMAVLESQCVAARP